MTAYFLDSSAAVKLYVAETGSDWLIDFADPGNAHEWFLVHIAAVEIAAAFYRRVRSRGLSLSQAAAALAALRRDMDRTFAVIEVSPALIDLALVVAERRALRGYD